MRGIKRSVSRRDLIKALGVSGITLGGIGTGVTVATDDEDNDNDNNTKKCPKDLDIVYVRKDGKWKHHVLNDNGKDNNDSEPDGLRIKGDKKKVKIYAHFPFAVSYATHKKKRHDEESDHDWRDKFKHCKKRKPVVAESVDSIYCATIKADKRKKKRICWFRIRCPNSDSGNHDWKHDKKHDRKHDKKWDSKDGKDHDESDEELDVRHDEKWDEKHDDRKHDKKWDEKHDDRKHDKKWDEKHDDRKHDKKWDEKHDDWKHDKKRDEKHDDRKHDKRRDKEDC